MFLAFEETEQSKIFPNEAFGYWKITVERPLRLATDLSARKLDQFDQTCRTAKEEPLAHLVRRVATAARPGAAPGFRPGPGRAAKRMPTNMAST